MEIRILTNLQGLQRVHLDGLSVQVERYPTRPSGLSASFRLWRQLAACDYALINCSPKDLLQLCMLKLLNPLARCRVISVDTVLPVPYLGDARARIQHWIKRLLFRQVRLFIEYFRDTRGYERHYGIPAGKFRYVPFKINRYQRVLATRTSDQGYIFSGGNTRRDFATLIEAVRGLPYPLRIVTMENKVIREHGSFVDESQLPPNIQVVRHDGSDTFVDHIAGARLVVLPVKKENISASGIGVYIASMALGKCVIISSGPAVDGVIPEGSAVVVPPEDVRALREAIVTAYTDEKYRNHVAQAGRAYALSLKDEERLYKSIIAVVAEDCGAPIRSPETTA